MRAVCKRVVLRAIVYAHVHIALCASYCVSALVGRMWWLVPVVLWRPVSMRTLFPVTRPDNNHYYYHRRRRRRSREQAMWSVMREMCSIGFSNIPCWWCINNGVRYRLLQPTFANSPTLSPSSLCACALAIVRHIFVDFRGWAPSGCEEVTQTKLAINITPDNRLESRMRSGRLTSTNVRVTKVINMDIRTLTLEPTSGIEIHSRGGGFGCTMCRQYCRHIVGGLAFICPHLNIMLIFSITTTKASSAHIKLDPFTCYKYWKKLNIYI